MPALLQDLLDDGLGALLRVGVIVRQKDNADAQVDSLVKLCPSFWTTSGAKIL